MSGGRAPDEARSAAAIRCAAPSGLPLCCLYRSRGQGQSNTSNRLLSDGASDVAKGARLRRTSTRGAGVPPARDPSQYIIAAAKCNETAFFLKPRVFFSSVAAEQLGALC